MYCPDCKQEIETDIDKEPVSEGSSSGEGVQTKDVVVCGRCGYRFFDDEDVDYESTLI